MAKLRIIIHPLFFVFGIYFALIGKVFSFIIFVVTALIHEFGHFTASEQYGYALNRIVLMPYGAVISGEAEALKYKDEIIIAFCGPLINFAVVIFFTAMWWLIPEIYAYTDLIVMANLSVATINLLPCYPLDGGRILNATLALYMPKKIAAAISRWIGIGLAVALFIWFIYSCFHTFNLSLLFFASFMLFGAVSNSEHNKYIRIYQEFSSKKFRHGVVVKKVAVEENSTMKELYRTIGTSLCDLIVISVDGKKKTTVPFDRVQKMLINGNFNESVKTVLDRTK